MKKTIFKLLFLFSIVLFCAFALFPFLWMVATSIKSDAEILMGSRSFIPQKFTGGSYYEVLFQYKFGLYFFNSILVALLSVAGVILIAAAAGLGFARTRFRWQKQLLVFTLFAQLFPLVLLIAPYFKMFVSIGLYNTHAALVISNISFTLPFSIWMLTNYLRKIPKEIELAAMIDGCTVMQTFVLVTIPLAIPGIVATTINAFIMSWNEFMFASTFIKDAALRTLPFALRAFMGELDTEWNKLMAASVISSLPVVVLFIVLQRKIVAGLTGGGVKG